MEYQDFQRGMARLAANYEKELSSPTVKAYWQVLQNVAGEDWARALDTICRSEQRWPSPATILKHVEGLPNRKGEFTCAETAAGSGGTDPTRPRRIGEACARAWLEGDVKRSDYFQTMIDHMPESEMRDATKARDDVLGERADAAGSDRGKAKFMAEARRLGLADAIPEEWGR